MPMEQVHWCLLVMWVLTEVARWILRCIGLHIQPNTPRLTEHTSQYRWIYTANQTQDFWRQTNEILFIWPSQSADFNQVEQLSSYLRQNWKQKDQQTSNKAWHSISREDKEIGDVYGLQTSVIICKRLPSKFEKTMVTFIFMLGCPNSLEPLKIEAHYIKCLQFLNRKCHIFWETRTKTESIL